MTRAAVAVAAAALLLLPACTGTPRARRTLPPAAEPAPSTAPPAEPAPPPPPPPAALPAAPAVPPFTALAAAFAERATAQERDGDLRGALGSWRLVSALHRGDPEPRQRAADLEERLGPEAGRRYRAALERLDDGDAAGARRELLLALAADPDHTAALEALRTRISPDTVAYVVEEGDSLEWIARKHYEDAGKAPIIARVNDLAPGARPAPGSVLVIPVLPPAPAPERPGRRGAAAAAEPADAGEALETAPDRIAPAPAAGEEEARRRERAEEAYLEGVSHFINQRLDEAVRAWERALALNPGHPKAQRDIEKVRELQEKLKEIR